MLFPMMVHTEHGVGVEHAALCPSHLNLYNPHSRREYCGKNRLFLRRLRLRLDHPLDNLCLLDKECADDPGLDAVTTPAATVRTSHGLLALGDGRIFPRAESDDARQRDTAVTALGHCSGLLEVVVDQLPSGSFDNTPAVGSGVVRRALAEGYALGHF